MCKICYNDSYKKLGAIALWDWNRSMRNNELRGPTAIDTDIIPSDSEHVFAQEALYQEAMMRYHCAILEMRTKLEVLSKDMTVRYRRNPIEFIESRLKKPSSIARKLKKMGLEVTVDNMTQHLSDIAGIRVLCAYIDDIYEIARMLARQKDVRIITVKDYIQIRTIAMDFWATLDLDMQYKKQVEDSEAIMRELRECADVIHQTDEKMMRLRERIHRIDPE